MTSPITDNPPTPTPWTVRETPNPNVPNRSWRELVVEAEVDDLVLGEVYSGDVEDSVAKANAAFIVRAVNSFEELVALAIQYRNDLRYPPAPDSVERRLAAIEAVIAKVQP